METTGVNGVSQNGGAGASAADVDAQQEETFMQILENMAASQITSQVTEMWNEWTREEEEG